MPKNRPPYAPEYRQQMVDLVRGGRTPEELSREFEPSAQSIWNWVRQAERDEGIRSNGLTTEEKELEATRHGLSYVQLDGEIGCMVNGAGLAMATMDIIKHLGGTPANFLDIGGSSSPEKVVHAMELLVSDENVKAIFINVFGGITRCDDVANGLVKALGQIQTDLPLVVRLTGTNEEEGRKILSDFGIRATGDMTGGALKAINLAAKGGGS